MGEASGGGATSKPSRRKARGRPAPARGLSAIVEAKPAGAKTKSAAPRRAAQKPLRQKASRPRGAKGAERRRGSTPHAEPVAVTAPPEQAQLADPILTLTEEERIESAKYLPRELPPRVFEEERFLFPETYGINRVRLLVKDPEWLFAHWDVDRDYFATLRQTLGERAAALSRLTLKIADPQHGGSSVVLLPYGARSWYIRTDTAGRSYRAQLGVTLPSGEFQLLAESNTVTAPRVGPAATRATTRVHYASGVVSLHSGASRRAADPGPWQPAPQGEGSGGSADEEGTPRKSSSDMAPRGGASETYRR